MSMSFQDEMSLSVDLNEVYLKAERLMSLRSTDLASVHRAIDDIEKIHNELLSFLKNNENVDEEAISSAVKNKTEFDSRVHDWIMSSTKAPELTLPSERPASVKSHRSSMSRSSSRFSVRQREALVKLKLADIKIRHAEEEAKEEAERLQRASQEEAERLQRASQEEAERLQRASEEEAERLRRVADEDAERLRRAAEEKAERTRRKAQREFELAAAEAWETSSCNFPTAVVTSSSNPGPVSMPLPETSAVVRSSVLAFTNISSASRKVAEISKRVASGGPTWNGGGGASRVALESTLPVSRGIQSSLSGDAVAGTLLTRQLELLVAYLPTLN